MFDKMNEGRWWDFGWQLVEGCTPVSEGCEHCWSLAKEHRLGISKEVRCMESRLDRPRKRKKPAAYAIWNDLFHNKVNIEFLTRVFDIIEQCPQHLFFILTKRPERAKRMMWGEHVGCWRYFSNIYTSFHPNVIFGTSAENQDAGDKRITDLLKLPGRKFVSLEPLLGPVDLEYIKDYEHPNRFTKYERIYSLTGKRSVLGHRMSMEKLDWVCVGAETRSPAHRRVDYNKNAIAIVEQCEAAGVPVFVKSAVVNDRVTKKIEEFPPELRLRQKPERTKE